MEGPVVDPEARRDPPQSVVARAGDDRARGRRGISGPPARRRPRTDRRTARRPGRRPRQRSPSRGRGAPRWPPDRRRAGGRPVTSGRTASVARPSMANRSAKADISSWIWARSSLIEVETTRRAAPAASASVDLLLRGGGQVARQRELDGGRVAAGLLGRTPHLAIRRASVVRRQPEGLEPVAEASGPSGSGLAVPPDVDGHPARVRPAWGRSGRAGTRRTRPSKSAPGRPGVGPQGAHGGDRLVGAPAPAPRIGSGGPELLVHPPHPDAHPHPAPRQDVDGGDPLGQDHRLMVGEHQHPGGQSDALGDRGQIGHQIERIGDPAVVGQRHLPRGGVGIGALVVGDDHRVLHQDHRFEPAGLGVAGERGHPLGVGGDPRADRGDDPEPHGLAHFRQCPAAAGSRASAARRAGAGLDPPPGRPLTNVVR